MKKEEILKRMQNAAELHQEGDFFIGCTIEEVLPNRLKTKLVCVDCSWLREWNGNTPIIKRNELDEIEDDENSINVIKEDGKLMFVKWVDMVDDDGDKHHCKIVTYADINNNIFCPITEDNYDYAIYIEL